MNDGLPVLAMVPPNAPLQTYDLVVSSGPARLHARHCVAVGRFADRIKIVHLSNMNIGDIGAPSFDPRLVDEINLVNPTLIVATGDYLDAACPNPEAGWDRLVDYFCGFDAPVVLTCGDHDDIALYSRYVAPSPVGLVNVGPHRCLILYDLPRSPVSRNPEQIRWLERVLGQPGFTGLTFVATHDDYPNLLEYWRRQGDLQRMLKAGRIGLWFASGHVDWNGHDYRDLIDAASPMSYVRTHQSSSAPRGGAEGVPHYRIVEINQNRVSFPGESRQTTLCPPSTPVGRLLTSFDGPQDGHKSRLAMTAVNNNPYRLQNLRKTVRLKKNIGYKPWCRGAEMTSILDLDSCWECTFRFDLPDKGVLNAELGSGVAPPLSLLTVEIEAPDQMIFDKTNTPQGATYYSSRRPPPIVLIRNNGNDPATVAPLIRFDGDLLAYRPTNQQVGFATGYRLRLAPGESIGLRVDLSAVRVAPGRRDLQVYLNAPAENSVYARSIEVVEAK